MYRGIVILININLEFILQYFFRHLIENQRNLTLSTSYCSILLILINGLNTSLHRHLNIEFDRCYLQHRRTRVGRIATAGRAMQVIRCAWRASALVL